MNNLPNQPPVTPVVYLRDAGVPEETQANVEGAFRAAGFWTTRDRLQALYLRWGGIPVFKVDFSADMRERY